MEILDKQSLIRAIKQKQKRNEQEISCFQTISSSSESSYEQIVNENLSTTEQLIMEIKQMNQEFKTSKKQSINEQEEPQQQYQDQEEIVQVNKYQKNYEYLGLSSMPQSIQRSSILTQRLSLQSGQLQMKLYQQIKIYLFKSDKFLTLNVKNENTVFDVKKTIWKELEKNEQIQIIKDYNAYELRILDDENQNQINYNFELTDDLNFNNLNVKTVGFIEKVNYKPKQVEYDEIPYRKNQIIKNIQVIYEDQNEIFHINIQQDLIVRDIFKALNKQNNKFNFNQTCYELKIANSNENSIFYQKKQLINLNLDMPLDLLKDSQIFIKKRRYADEPVCENNIIKQNTFSQLDQDQDDDQEIFNHVKASKYEEFDVIKINSRGVRQPRIMGIDNLKIYNKKQKNNLINFARMLSLVEVNNPELIVEDIESLEQVGAVHLVIRFFSNKKIKERNYEFKNAKILNYVKSKIQYLIQNCTYTKKSSRNITQNEIT